MHRVGKCSGVYRNFTILFYYSNTVETCTYTHRRICASHRCVGSESTRPVVNAGIATSNAIVWTNTDHALVKQTTCENVSR